MELCLLNLLILIVFCVILTLVSSLRACHMWLTRNHVFISEIWGKFTSSIFWNFEISLVFELGEFIPNFPLKNVITSTNYSVSIYFFTLFVCNSPLKIRKIRNITALKKCLVELLIYIWHSIQKALKVIYYIYIHIYIYMIYIIYI